MIVRKNFLTLARCERFRPFNYETVPGLIAPTRRRTEGTSINTNPRVRNFCIRLKRPSTSDSSCFCSYFVRSPDTQWTDGHASSNAFLDVTILGTEHRRKMRGLILTTTTLLRVKVTSG